MDNASSKKPQNPSGSVPRNAGGKPYAGRKPAAPGAKSYGERKPATPAAKPPAARALTVLSTTSGRMAAQIIFMAGSSPFTISNLLLH